MEKLTSLMLLRWHSTSARPAGRKNPFCELPRFASSVIGSETNLLTRHVQLAQNKPRSTICQRLLTLSLLARAKMPTIPPSQNSRLARSVPCQLEIARSPRQTENESLKNDRVRTRRFETSNTHPALRLPSGPAQNC